MSDQPPGIVPDRPRFVLGVTTLNRIGYLTRFISSFNETRSDDFDWLVIVADDGSTDETLEWLQSSPEVAGDLLVIENKRVAITGQTNSIFQAAIATDFDFGFKCDDDVFFTRPGWDHLYYDTALRTGMRHLVYHNSEWKPPEHAVVQDGLVSSVQAENCMGCLYTFDPEVLHVVGAFDEQEFPVRGHAHIDFTVRACRAGFNDEMTLWDARGSAEYVGMWAREDYIESFPWSLTAFKKIQEPAEQERRWNIIRTPGRVHVSFEKVHQGRSRSRCRVPGGDDHFADRLTSTGFFDAREGPASEIDRYFVLSLDHASDDYVITSGMFARHGFEVERFPAVDGRDLTVQDAWESYAANGLTLPIETQIGRKLIQSAGAWAYLDGMRSLFAWAREARWKRVAVFDDDVMLHRDFREGFEQMSADLPPDWAMALLGWTADPTEGSEFKEFSTRLRRASAAFNGSYAVVVDARAYDTIIEVIDRREWPFDAGPLREVTRQFPDQCFALREPLAIADVSDSLIRDTRNHDEFWRSKGHRPELYEQRQGPRSNSVAPVSVVVCLADDGRFLDDCLRSLLRQTDPDFEVVVATYRAPVGTPAKVAEVLSRDPRVAWSNAEARRVVSDLVAASEDGAVALVPSTLAVTSTFIESLRAALDRCPDAAAVTGLVSVGSEQVPPALTRRADVSPTERRIIAMRSSAGTARHLTDLSVSGIPGDLSGDVLLGWAGRDLAAKQHCA